MDRAEVKILPPVVLAAALGLQVLVATLFPTRAISGAVAVVIGVAVVAVSIALVVPAVREIVRAKTAFDARKPTTTIVTTGVYQFTRNPVYFSMILLVVGFGVILNSPWALFLAIPTGSALCLTAIRPEEQYLEGKFNDAYRAYRNAVPRWLSPRRLMTTLLARSEA